MGKLTVKLKTHTYVSTLSCHVVTNSLCDQALLTPCILFIITIRNSYYIYV